jgi:hypothetical protein
MERPYYENKDDLHNERNIVEKLSIRWGCYAIKLPLRYGFDFGLLRNGRMMAAVEIKKRDVTSTTYPDIILSLAKAECGERFRKWGIIPMFVVEFQDGIYKHRISLNHQYKIDMGGRQDRGDWQDMEPVIHIPMKLFKRVNI